MTAPRTLTEFLSRRLDAHLATFTSDSGRRVFLRSEAEKWETRYARFVERVARGDEIAVDPVYGKPTATDFVLTISMIGARLAKLNEKVAA